MSIDTLTPDAREARVSNALIENVDVRVETFLGGAIMTVAQLHALRQGAVVGLGGLH